MFVTLMHFNVLALAGCILLGGCGSSGRKHLDIEPAAAPAALLEIEGLAEDTYDRALLSDLDAVSRNANAISQAWGAFRSEADSAGAPAAALASLDQAAANLVTVAAASAPVVVLGRGANAVSAPMEALFEVYDHPAPGALLTLDYLGRELVLDAMAADFAAASGHLLTLETRWASLKASVLERDGDAVALDYDDSIAAIAAGIRAERADAISVGANKGLEAVDGMEGLFTVEDPGD